MIDSVKINKELKQFIEDICDEYRQKFRIHRKNVTHLFQNGCFKEWESYKYTEK